ncbi:MAG: F0F1 ATP synthase subunit B [bacterium]
MSINLGIINIEPGQLVIHIVGFIVLFLVLRKFLWKPILGLMEQREREVKGVYDRAEEVEKKTLELRSDYEERIAKIDEEAQKRLAEGVKKGQRMAAEIVEDARRETEKERQKALNTIQEETKKARVELRDYIVSLSFSMAEKLLHREVSRQTHQDLVRQFLDDVASKGGTN